MVSIFDEGSLTTVSGVMGGGKSDFTNLLCFLALHQDVHIISNLELDIEKTIAEIEVFLTKMQGNGKLNIKDLKSDIKKITNMLKRYHIVHNDIEFLKEVIKERRNASNHGFVLILDEANLFSTSKRALNFDAILFEMFISAIRKFYCSMIVVIQRYSNFLPLIRELSFCNISKVTKTEALFEVYPINKVFTVVNIPKSPICFYTHGFSGFQFKLDWFRLINDLKDLPDVEVMDFLKKQAKNDFCNYIRFER